jgi:hypothetical protein
MGAKPVLVIAGVRPFKVVSCLFADKEFEASVKFCSNLANNSKRVYLSYSWLLFEHKIGHVCPMGVDKSICERETQ